jgi:hypothetical protein
MYLSHCFYVSQPCYYYYYYYYYCIRALSYHVAEVSMNQRWGVQNHIQTVHAIAVCNLVEMTMGMTAEGTIPAHLRWLPMGMDVRYLKKSMGTLTATCSIDPEKFFELEKYPGEVGLPVEVRNTDGVVVTDAIVKLWISEKPVKK